MKNQPVNLCGAVVTMSLKTSAAIVQPTVFPFPIFSPQLVLMKKKTVPVPAWRGWLRITGTFSEAGKGIFFSALSNTIEGPVRAAAVTSFEIMLFFNQCAQPFWSLLIDEGEVVAEVSLGAVDAGHDVGLRKWAENAILRFHFFWVLSGPVCI